MNRLFSIILLISLSSIQCGAVGTGLRSTAPLGATTDQRQRERSLSSWMSNFYNSLVGEKKGSGSSKKSGSSHSSGKSGSSGSSGTSSTSSSGGNSNGGESTSYASGGDGGDGGDSSYVAAEDGSDGSYIVSSEMDAESWEEGSSTGEVWNGNSSEALKTSSVNSVNAYVFGVLALLSAAVGAAIVARRGVRARKERVLGKVPLNSDEPGTPAFIEVSKVKTAAVNFSGYNAPQEHVAAKVMYNC